MWAGRLAFMRKDIYLDDLADTYDSVALTNRVKIGLLDLNCSQTDSLRFILFVSLFKSWI